MKFPECIFRLKKNQRTSILKFDVVAMAETKK